MATHYSSLTDEEKERNSFGKCFQYSYDKNLNFNYPTSYPGVFEDINSCKAKVAEVHREKFHLEISQLKKGLLKGTKLDTYFHGFPTMKHIKHTSYLKKAGVRVFQQNSRSHNTIVKILADNKQPMSELAKQLVGETVYVEWPYMVEASVTSICDDAERYSLDERNELTSTLVRGDDYKIAKREMKSIETTHYSRRGVELGEVKVLVEAKTLLGKRYVFGQKGAVTLEREYNTHSNNYALQAVVKDLNVHTEQKEVFESIDTLYPPGANVFMLGSPHYGCSGEVIECQLDVGRIRVALKVQPEPSFDNIIQHYDSLAVHYVSDKAVAQRVGITTGLLARITGNVEVRMNRNAERGESYNIGLGLKYSGQNREKIGYARRAESGWTYSPATIAILRQYMEEFPEVFEAIGSTHNHDMYLFSDLWPKKNKLFLDNIMEFLRKLPTHHVTPVRCGSNALDEPIVQAIEDKVDKIKEVKGERKIVKAKVRPHVLFRPTEEFGKLSPDQETVFFLFDRVVNVQNGSVVPVGMRGSVIGIHEDMVPDTALISFGLYTPYYAVLSDQSDKDSATETKYEILFDEPFLGALQIRSKGRRCYFMNGNSLINLSFGDRKEKIKKGIPLTTPMKFQSEISKPLSPSKEAGTSPFSQRTPGILHTPPHLFNDASFKNGSNKYQSTPQQQKSKDEPSVSPDYWLKGRYASPGNYSSTPQHHNSRRNQQRRVTPQSADNNEFMSMWHVAEEASKSEQGKQGDNFDKNATEALQQMLHISPQNKKQQKQHYDGKQRNQQARYSGDNSKQSPQDSGGNRGHSPYQKNSLAALRKYCSQMQLPAPRYIYSQSPQGVGVTMMIGKINLKGNVCSTQQQALESAAAISLTYLRQHQNVNSPPRYGYNQSPVTSNYSSPRGGFGYNQPRQQYSPQQRMLYESPKILRTSPHQQKQNYSKGHIARQSNSDTNVSSQPRQQCVKDLHQSNSDTSIAITQKQSQTNPFIPHQVVVKNKAPQQSAQSSSFNNADNELKGMLGIRVKGKDEELKDLIGIGKPSDSEIQNQPPQIQTMQMKQSHGDTILKNLIGVKQEPSDDDKLKTMLGIGENEPQMLKREEQPQDPLVDLLSTFNISSNISKPPETHNTAPAQAVRPTQTPPVNTSQNDGISKKSTKKQILLAPSFFGPRKK